MVPHPRVVFILQLAFIEIGFQHDHPSRGNQLFELAMSKLTSLEPRIMIRVYHHQLANNSIDIIESHHSRNINARPTAPYSLGINADLTF